MTQVEQVLAFWFEEIKPAQWWRKNLAFDAEVRRRFGYLHGIAENGDLTHWRSNAEGRLAEVLILDQFSRNLYRNQARAYASDRIAQEQAEAAITLGLDLELAPSKRAFLYMPFMHSESAAHQHNSVELFATIEATGNLRSAQRHRAVIEKFGRFPHRNDALKRPSTTEEEMFLRQPGARF